MIFQTLEVFQKDLKKLSKKYPTLVTDIEVVKKVLVLHPEAKPPFSFVLQGLGIETPIIKIKKIASRSLWAGECNPVFVLCMPFTQKKTASFSLSCFTRQNN